MENQTTEKRVPLPRPGKDFNTAKHLYMEQFGSALVTNNLLVALAGVSLVAAVLVWLNLRAIRDRQSSPILGTIMRA